MRPILMTWAVLGLSTLSVAVLGAGGKDDATSRPVEGTPSALPQRAQPLVNAIPTTMSTTMPTTMPATMPVASGSVRGRVTAAGGLDLMKPDLSRVIVYVASEEALDALPLPEPRATVAQHNKEFVPNFVVVTRGTDVEFPNWDHFDHNVFSRSKAAPAFDLDRYPYGMSKTRQFTKVGIVQVFCNVHPSMRAMIFVTPNRFFARADAEGRFELSGLPAGRHDLVVWQERCDEQHKTVDIRVGETAEVDFALEPSRANILANTPSDHRAGYGVERGLGIKREQLGLPVVSDAHPAPPDSSPPGR